MFTGMSDFSTHLTDDESDDEQVRDGYDDAVQTPGTDEQDRGDHAPTKVTQARVPSGLDRRGARQFARRVLTTRAALGELEPADVDVLERLTGERKLVRGNLDELAVVLSTADGSGAGTALGATRDLLALQDPMDAVVEATMLATDHPDTFREVFALTRDLGVHDLARTPAGHEVKAARALVGAFTSTDTTTVAARLDRLVELLG